MLYSWIQPLPATTQTSTFAFTFTTNPKAHFTFSFSKCMPHSFHSPHNRPFKRRRPLWDVDGGPSPAGKKKRRLRLNLITSPLSCPFSSPATNIADRGNTKIAVWARGRRLDKSLLRKAAIMNRVRTSLVDRHVVRRRRSTEQEQEEEVFHRQRVMLREVRAENSRSLAPPLPPSPLHVHSSYYDELDLEDDDMYDGEDEEDEEDENGDDDGGGSGGRSRSPAIYSDFREMKPTGMDDGVDEYDYLDNLDGLPSLPEERPPPPPDKGMVEILKEQERQKEGVSCFVTVVT